MQTERKCQRCGISEYETPEGFLALNGDRLVCGDCNDFLDDELAAGLPERRPTNALHHSVPA